MSRTVARRVYLALPLNTLVAVAVLIGVVWFAFERAERLMMAQDKAEEVRYFLDSVEGPTVLNWRTPTLQALYLPDALAAQTPLPPPFDTLAFPYDGEFEGPAQVLALQSGRYRQGRYYFAKDISGYEHREAYVGVVLACVTLVVLLLSTLLSLLVGRRLVSPLKALAAEIRALTPGDTAQLVQGHYREQELHDIAAAFNQFSSACNASYRREKALVAMASHELRTPIAIISGAAEILARDLAPAQQRPMERLRRAAEEMNRNITGLLSLSRHDARLALTDVDGPALAAEVAAELGADGGPDLRRLELPAERHLYPSEPVLLKMLLRNLIQNALQHSTGRVSLRFGPGWIEVADTAERRRLETQPADAPPLSGLGLYIVTLICERLRLEIELPRRPDAEGHCIRLRFPPGPDQPSPPESGRQ